MSFGGGFATGMGAGIGSGLAMGVSSGRKKAASEIREYIESNGFTILNREGKPIKVDQFFEDAVGQQCCGTDADTNPRVWAVAVVAGLLALGVAAAVAIYFIAAN